MEVAGPLGTPLGKGLILPSGGTHVVFLELRRHSKNTGAGCHALLQGIFPTQGSNPCLSHNTTSRQTRTELSSKINLLGAIQSDPWRGGQGLSLGCEVRPACVSGDTSSFTRPRGMLVDAAGWGGRKTTLLVGGPVSQLEPGATRGEPKGKQCPPPPAQRGLFSGHWGPCQGLEGGCSKQSVLLKEQGCLPHSSPGVTDNPQGFSHLFLEPLMLNCILGSICFTLGQGGKAVTS